MNMRFSHHLTDMDFSLSYYHLEERAYQMTMETRRPRLLYCIRPFLRRALHPPSIPTV